MRAAKTARILTTVMVAIRQASKSSGAPVMTIRYPRAMNVSNRSEAAHET
jgi:hypothetical protein